MHKESVIHAPILHYPDLKKHYIVYTDASHDACRVQLSQEHDGWKLNENGVPQNKRPMVYIMQSLNGITTFKELK